jgi:hypothetical protein
MGVGFARYGLIARFDADVLTMPDRLQRPAPLG